MKPYLRPVLVGLAALLFALPALASTPTTNYAWAKPSVGGDADNWGTLYNTDLDGIDSTVFGMCPKAGCTYTGPVIAMIGDATHAPLKLQAGTNLTVPVAGAVEWDGTNLFLTQTTGPTRKTVAYTDSNTTGSAAKLTTARAITETGDVSWTVSFDGSGAASAAATIQANAVTNAKSATMADGTIKCNASGSTAVPSDCVVGAYGPLQNSQSAAYGLVLADQGKEIYHPSADTTARVWTIPANASVAYLIGTKIEITNDCSAGVLTIAITSDTLVWYPSGGTGSRTMAACGKATLTKETATRWSIVGTGLS